jgi:hypothetical protein
MATVIPSIFGRRGLTDAVEGFVDTRLQIEDMQERQKNSAMQRKEIQKRIDQARQTMEHEQFSQVQREFELLSSFMPEDTPLRDDPAGLAMADRLSAELGVEPDLLYNWTPNETTFEDLMREELTNALENASPELRTRLGESGLIASFGADKTPEELVAQASGAELNILSTDLMMAHIMGDLEGDPHLTEISRNLLGLGPESVPISVGGVELQLSPEAAAQTILTQLKMDLEWHMMSAGEKRDLARDYTNLLNEHDIGVAEHNVRRAMELHADFSAAMSVEEREEALERLQEFAAISHNNETVLEFLTAGIDLSQTPRERLVRSNPVGASFLDALEVAEQYETLSPFLESREGRETISRIMEAATGFRLSSSPWYRRGSVGTDLEVGEERDPTQFTEIDGTQVFIPDFVNMMVDAVSRGEALRAQFSGRELEEALENDPNAVLISELENVPGLSQDIRTEIIRGVRAARRNR